jgi:hypothetical protein
MSLEQQLAALTAAVEANTAALLGGAKAAPAATAEKSAPADKPAADKPPKATKGKPAYEARHTKSEAQAAVNEVKEKLGVATAKGLIKKAGGDKLADLTTDEQFDTLYDLAKEALGAEDGGEEDGI